MPVQGPWPGVRAPGSDGGGGESRPWWTGSPGMTRGSGRLLALLVLAAYANSFPGAYLSDDFPIILNNPLVNEPRLSAILTADYLGAGGQHRSAPPADHSLLRRQPPPLRPRAPSPSTS